MSTIYGEDLLGWLLEEKSNIASFATLENAVGGDVVKTHEVKYIVEGIYRVDPEVKEPESLRGIEKRLVRGQRHTYVVLLKRQERETARISSNGLNPGLTGTGQGGSRCPQLDGLACGNLWLQREPSTRDLFWVDASMRELQAHSRRGEEILSSLWRLEPTISRPLMGIVFRASWDKSGADPKLRAGASLRKPAIDPLYLRDVGLSLPSMFVDNALAADFDYVHTATSLSRSTEDCSCKLCLAIDTVTRPLFERNVVLGDLGNMIVSALVSVDLCLKARETATAKGTTVSNGYIKFVPALPSDSCHPRIEGTVFPKGDGVGQVRSAEMARVFQAFEARGIMRNTCVYSVSAAYDFFVYGGPYGGLWAMLDTQFLYDYAIGSQPDCDTELELIRKRCVRVAKGAGHEYVGDCVTLKLANYVQTKFKMEIEEAVRATGKRAPGYVVWDDLRALCAFRCTDAIFINVAYDSRGDDVSFIILGGLVAVHDFIDLGYDIASGEIGNIVPTLCGGNIQPEPLRRSYARVGALLAWAMENRKYEPDSLGILSTFIWQLSNARHRVMENAAAVPDNLRVRVEWRLEAPIPRYGDLVDDLRYTKSSPERFPITLPWSGEVVFGGQALSRVVMQAKRPEEQEVIELFLIKFLTGATQPGYDMYNPAALRLMCDDDWQRKVDFTWALCMAMYEEGILYAAAISSLRITRSRPANDDRAGMGYEDRSW